MNKISCLIALLLVVGVGITQADFIFEIQFHSYLNPTQGSHANNGCCDSSNGNREMCRSGCDTYLHLCLTRTSNMQVSVPAEVSECPFGYIRTDLLRDRNGDNIVFNDENLDRNGGVKNPVVFLSNRKWPGSIQVIIQSYDQDGGTDDFIDIELANLTESSLELNSIGFTQQRTYFGMFGLSRYELSFRVYCAPNYYGSNCSIYCEGRNDLSGNYYCDENGSRQCLNGYTNPLTNCTQCEPSEGCSPVGGYCMKPHECLCSEGFTGENCTIPIGNQIEGSMVGVIAGSTVSLLLLLIISLSVILFFVIVFGRRKQTISNMTESRMRAFQENEAYIDFIHRDSLNRSVEMAISPESHYVLDPPPIGHIQRLGVTHYIPDNRINQETNLIDVNQFVTSSMGSSSGSIGLNCVSKTTSLAISDTESSVSLHKACFSGSDEEHNFKDMNESQCTTNLSCDQEDVIPLKRNDSYRVLDIEHTDSQAEENTGYSYPKLCSRNLPFEGGYTTVGNKCEGDEMAYSKIELSNMYENIEKDDNMIENEMYGTSMRAEEQFMPGLLDSYLTESL